MVASSLHAAAQLTPAGLAARPRRAAVVSSSPRAAPRIGRAGRLTAAAAGKEQGPVSVEATPLFLLQLGTVLAAAPLARAEEGAAAAVDGATAAASDAASAATSAAADVQPEAVDSAVSSVIDAVKAAGGAVKTGISLAGQGAGYVKDAAETAAPYLKRSIDAATPYVKATAEAVSEAAKPVIKAATPALQAGVGEVEQFLTSNGLNPRALVDGTRGVTSKAEEALNAASPTLKSTAGSLSAASPATLGQYALGAVALYYLGPPVLKGVFGSLRGYAGQISPAAALDAASNDANALIIDIRPGIDKELSGIPDLPNGGRLIELEYVTVADRRVRNQLRNVSAIERTMTVLQIAALKKVKRSSRILLLDKNGGQAKDVARDLAARGFKNAFVVAGGFSGWTSAKLQTKGSSSVSAVEVLGPVFGTRGTRGTSGRSSSPARSDRPPTRPARYLPTGR